MGRDRGWEQRGDGSDGSELRQEHAEDVARMIRSGVGCNSGWQCGLDGRGRGGWQRSPGAGV